MTSALSRFALPVGAVAACLLGLPIYAQSPAEPPASPAPTATPAPATPAAPDPKVVKQLESLLQQKFSRDPSEILLGLEKTGLTDPNTLPANDRFNYRFRTGDWVKIREELAAMPPDLARKIFDKMLADLTEKQKPGLRLDDVLGLADAAPGEINADEVRKIGQLLNLTVPVTETFWLTDRLQKGTLRLGGTDPAKRVLAARVLLAGSFKEMAREYLPAREEIEKMPDEGVRNELLSFLSSERESEAVERAQLQRVWDESLHVLSNPKINDYEKSRTSQSMAKVLQQMSPATLTPLFQDLIKTKPDIAVRLLGGMGRKNQHEKNNDGAARTENLRNQVTLAGLMAESADLSVDPWNQLAEMMAEYWISEAENTVTQKAANVPATKYVSTEEILATTPGGKWAAALSQPEKDRLDVTVSKVILASADFEQAAPRIIEIAKRRPAAGVALAEEFLSAWARAHNPQLPEALRKKYELPDDARIPVTPMMMEKNIGDLSAMMALFRQANLVPKDYSKIVTAFDLAYANAEAYRSADIEKVFGPLEKMDEPVFFLILSRMNQNLAERWRKMDVQKAGLTKRDEGQTLELVRNGYQTALNMIETWLKGHPDGSHALTLAGTLLCDWGDFEYFQELVTADARKRMTGFKEKNMQAQEYFQRGAEAYAKEVPKLAPADYSVDAYLNWFNGLLGIGSGGQLNLSKAMNRAALTKIRESMLALPGKAGPAHVNKFAKFVNARLTDEKEPLHEDLRYRYLASALVITKDDPFTLGAEKKVAYFDELLNEVRLQTRTEGPNTVGRDQDFGIIISVVHTEAMGRVAKFGQYLSSDPNALALKQAGAKKKNPLAKKMRDAQSPRDELELNITEALSPFFDIRSITFSSPDAKARPTAKPGWQETVLAYVQAHPKDASVDKIPPVELELKFIDMNGPITIPAESAETIIKVAPEAPPRPVKSLEIAETLDTRQLNINGSLNLEIKAKGTGLVPELEQIIDLDALKKSIAVKNVNPHNGLQVKEINTWGDEVAPLSERLWTVSLDGDPIRAAEEPTEFHYPPAKVKDAVVTYQTYKDMDLVKLDAPSTMVGRALAPGEAPHTQNALYKWLGSLAALLIGGAAILITAWRKPRLDVATGESGETYAMPKEVDGFAVVALLRRLRKSVKVPENQRAALQDDLQRVQQSCFSAGPSGVLSEADLRGVAEKWLRFAQ